MAGYEAVGALERRKNSMAADEGEFERWGRSTGASLSGWTEGGNMADIHAYKMVDCEGCGKPIRGKRTEVVKPLIGWVWSGEKVFQLAETPIRMGPLLHARCYNAMLGETRSRKAGEVS